MNNTDDNYISLFNQSTNITVDNITIKQDNNNQIYVNEVNTNLIKFSKINNFSKKILSKLTGNNKFSKKIMGWSPQHDIEAAISLTIKKYKKNLYE